MIISIITGGSGSENIQRELYKINKEISLNLIINGYDDGKSTGKLRNVFKNTLGISDFRKNQILEYEIRGENKEIYELLNERFTKNINIYDYLKEKIIEKCKNNEILKDFLISNIKYFFKLKITKDIKYEDFSIMNIIYSSLLHKNNNNMIKKLKLII